MANVLPQGRCWQDRGYECRLTNIRSMFKGRERPFKMSGSIRSENIHSTTLDNGEISEEKQPHHNSLVLGVKSISLRALCHMTETFPSRHHLAEALPSSHTGANNKRGWRKKKKEKKGVGVACNDKAYSRCWCRVSPEEQRVRAWMEKKLII